MCAHVIDAEPRRVSGLANPFQLTRAIGLTALSLIALAGCGGGGGDPGPSAQPIAVTPPATPPASPPPATPVTPVFGTLGQTSSQSFALLGFSYSGLEVGWGDFAVEPASVDPDLSIGLRFVAPEQLLLSLSGLGEESMIPNGGGAFDTLGRPFTLAYRALGGNASLSIINRPGGGYLTSSAIGSWAGLPSNGARPVYRVAQFAYGVPTTASQVPATGTVSYVTSIYGLIAVASAGGVESGYYEGTARLSIDFASRTVSGTIELAGPASTTYTLAPTALQSDGTVFTGRLISSRGGGEGVIEGRLTGSTAGEMIVRWRAPAVFDGRTGVAFGAWGSGASS